MEKKTDIARRLAEQGKLKEALRITKGFRIGVTVEQANAMGFAYECIVHPDFYKMLGRDIEKTIEDGTEVMKGVLQIG